MKKTNIEVLNYIFQNANMGILSIDSILKNYKHKKFCNLMKMQKEEYIFIREEALKIFTSINCKPKNISFSKKIISKIMISININESTGVSKLAKMMIKSTNIGIVDITQRLNSHKITNKKVENLAKTLKQIEENNANELKIYL